MVKKKVILFISNLKHLETIFDGNYKSVTLKSKKLNKRLPGRSCFEVSKSMIFPVNDEEILELISKAIQDGEVDLSNNTDEEGVIWFTPNKIAKVIGKNKNFVRETLQRLHNKRLIKGSSTVVANGDTWWKYALLEQKDPLSEIPANENQKDSIIKESNKHDNRSEDRIVKRISIEERIKRIIHHATFRELGNNNSIGTLEILDKLNKEMHKKIETEKVESCLSRFLNEGIIKKGAEPDEWFYNESRKSDFNSDHSSDQADCSINSGDN